MALVLLIAYNYSFQLSLIAGVVTLAFLAAIFPWLIRQSLRFRARYSSYRGIHFRFVGGLAEIYLIAAPLIFFVVPFALLGFYAEDKAGPSVWFAALLGVATFIYLVLLPYLHYRFKRYQHGNTFLGSAAARFTATAGNFYAVYGILFAVSLASASLRIFVRGCRKSSVQARRKLRHRPARAADCDYAAYFCCLPPLWC